MSHTWSIDPVTANNKSGALIVCAVVLTIFSTAILIWRLVERFKYSNLWATDDIFVLISFSCSAAQVGSVCAAVRHGYGKHIWSISSDQLELVQKFLFAAQLLYIASICFSKVSAAFLVARINNPHRRIATTWILVGSSLVWGFSSILVVALRGDLSAPWVVMDGQVQLFYRWLGVEVSSIVQEGLVLCLCAQIIYKVQITQIKRWMAFGALASRFTFTTPAVGARLYLLFPLKNSDLTFSTIPASILTQISMHLSVLVASNILINPFLRPFDNERRPEEQTTLRHTSTNTSGQGLMAKVDISSPSSM